MSEQLLLQGKILGIEEFLISGAPSSSLLTGRSQWITLLSEVLPRALLAELGLARILLGSSGGGQFLLVLPAEQREAAEEFLSRAAQDVAGLSGGAIRLVWSVTENLGDWSVVRRRLTDELQRKRNAPFSAGAPPFEPFAAPEPSSAGPYFSDELGAKLREAKSVGWSPESPAMVTTSPGRHNWSLSSNLSLDGISLARHAAPSEDGKSAASVKTLSRRAQGKHMWAVLRGDVDNFSIRLRRLHNIEEHVQLSVLYKQFFAGELEVLCSLPEFWRKVTILHSGGDDFAVYGSWDALVPLARELQRLFQRFTEENLKDFPGPEARTISMALALALGPAVSLASVYQEAGRNLEIAQSADKDCIYVMGRILEWKQLADAADLKDAAARMMTEFRSSRRFLAQLRGFYQSEFPSLDRLRRFERRYHRMLAGSKDRDFQKLLGRSRQPEAKLRPAGMVALEWARLATED